VTNGDQVNRGVLGRWTTDGDGAGDSKAGRMPGVTGDGGAGVIGSGSSNLATICSTSNHLHHTQHTWLLNYSIVVNGQLYSTQQ